MKKSKFLSFVLLLILTIFFPNKLFALTPFDEYYGNISWNEEKNHLDRFAIYLKQEPQMIGCMVFIIGRKDTTKNFNFRINRAKKYLFSKHNIAENRIVIYKGNPTENAETKIYLQPLPKDTPPPNFQ